MPYKIVAFLKRVAFAGVFFSLFIACENNIEDVKALTQKKTTVETGTSSVYVIIQIKQLKERQNQK